MPHRIAISGSAGTGKTTLAKALADRLQVPYLEEGFRKRREAGLDPHDLSRAEHRVLLMELYEEAIAAAAGCNGGFIQDRCPLDFLAFWLHYGFWREDAESAAFYARVQKDLDQYDHVIVLPWGTFDIAADSIGYDLVVSGYARGYVPSLEHRSLERLLRATLTTCGYADEVKELEA